MANEKRLIDANALLKELRQELRDCQKDAEEFGGENILWAEGIEFAIDTVKQTKTVDAVEVVHRGCDWCNGDYHTKIMATAIRYHSNGNMDGYEMKVNYCPNCGAKMDGGNEDEKDY